MYESLRGTVAIVTGAGSRAAGIGNGRATATLLARAGSRVALIDEVRESAEATAQLIKDEGGETIVVEANVTDEDQCQAAVEAITRELGAIRILVNNVGINGPSGDSVSLDPDAWDDCFRVNVKSMMLMSRYCVPQMELRGGGAIVNISSIGGLLGGHPKLAYASSKGAVVNLTRAMAAHHGSAGIRVNCVAPGLVHTPMVTVRGMTPELRDKRRLRSLLGTEGDAWDVGNAVVFLCSEEAKWITGVVLPVDGGYTAALSDYPSPL